MTIAAIPRDWRSLCCRKRTNIASCSQRRWCLSMSGYNHEILSGEAAGWYQGLTQQHASSGGVKLVDCQWLTCNTRVRQLSSSNSNTDDVILSDRLKNSKVLLILFIWIFSRCLGILIKAMNVDHMVAIKENTLKGKKLQYQRSDITCFFTDMWMDTCNKETLTFGFTAWGHPWTPQLFFYGEPARNHSSLKTLRCLSLELHTLH